MWMFIITQLGMFLLQWQGTINLDLKYLLLPFWSYLIVSFIETLFINKKMKF